MNSEFGIIENETRESDGFKHLTVDTNKASYQGIPYNTLGDFGRKKFENLLVLTRAKEKIKVLYVQTTQ